MAADLDKKLLQVSKFIQKGQLERAVKEYKKLATIHKKDPKILNSLGDTYIKMKEVDLAMEVFNDVADKYIKDGFYPNAIAIFRKMLRFKPDEIEVKLRLADLYVKVGMFSDAEFYYNQFADHYVHRGEIIKAIPAFEKICSINPENIELRKTLAGLYFRVENIDKMFSMYKEVFDYLMQKKDNEGLADVFNTVTAISNKNNLLTSPTYFTIFEQYITYLHKMNEGSLAKKSAMDMAAIYMGLGNQRWAQALYNKVLELDPGEMSARIKLIEFYKELGESKLLVEEYLKMAQYLKETDPSRANVIYSEVLQLDPDNVEARTALHKEEKAEKPQVAKEEKKIKEPAAKSPSAGESETPADLVETPEIETQIYDEEEKDTSIDLSVESIEASKGDDFKEKLQSVDLAPEKADDEPEITVEIEEEKEETHEASPVETESVQRKKGYFDDDEEMNIEFEVEVGPQGQLEVKEKLDQNESLETALSDIFSQYSDKLGKEESLLTKITEMDSEKFIPSVDEIVNTFKKGLEEQLGGDPQAHYDMGIAYKEMGLYDSAIGEFRRLALLPQFRFKSLNLLAQCLVEKGDYQEGVDEFLEVLGDEELSVEERDGVLYNIMVAYYRAEKYAESFDYYQKLSSVQIFKKDELFNEIRKKLMTLFNDSMKEEDKETVDLTIEHDENPFGESETEEVVISADEPDEGTHDEEEIYEESHEEFLREKPVQEAFEASSVITQNVLSEIEELKESVATNEDLIKDNSELITLLLQSREEMLQLKGDVETLARRLERFDDYPSRLDALEEKADHVSRLPSLEEDDAISLEEKRLLIRDLKSLKAETEKQEFAETLDFIRRLKDGGGDDFIRNLSAETERLTRELEEARRALQNLSSEAGRKGSDEKSSAELLLMPEEEAASPALPALEEEPLLPGPDDRLEKDEEKEDKDDEQDDKISYF